MRERDTHKASFEKAAKTISFERVVLEKLEDKAKRERTTVSNLVNTFCKKIVLNDVEFYRELAKFHYLEFQKFNYMKDQAGEKDII